MTTPAGFAPSNVDDLPAIVCAECGAAALHWVPPQQQMSDALEGLVACSNCNMAFVLESPFAPGVPMARHAPNPGPRQGVSVVCPKCGGREVGLLPRSNWREDNEGLSVAFACAPCRTLFYQEVLK